MLSILHLLLSIIRQAFSMNKFLFQFWSPLLSMAGPYTLYVNVTMSRIWHIEYHFINYVHEMKNWCLSVAQGLGDSWAAINYAYSCLCVFFPFVVVVSAMRLRYINRPPFPFHFSFLHDTYMFGIFIIFYRFFFTSLSLRVNLLTSCTGGRCFSQKLIATEIKYCRWQFKNWVGRQFLSDRDDQIA